MAKQSGKRWTEEMDEFLIEHAGTKPLLYIANKLNRTEGAVKRRIQRIGVEDKHLSTGTFSAYELATTIGICSKVVTKWIKEKGLRATQGAFYNTPNKFVKHKSYYIQVDDFWKWAEQNKDCLNWHQVPKHCLPPEPKWVQEQRRIDFFKGENRKNKWTPEQDNYIWNCYYVEGLKQKEIALLTGRTASGVEKRLKRLREKRLTKA